MTTESTDDLLCPGCGYDLRAIESDRCPECGLAVDRTASAVSQIPWAHRKRIGRVRAFLSTVRLATFRPRALAEELNRPVGYRDAQWFRAVVVVLAAAGPLAAVLLAMAQNQWLDEQEVPPLGNLAMVAAPNYIAAFDLGLPWFAGMQLCPVFPIAIVIAFLFITGAGSYFFAPRSLGVVRQNRAIALSYYASAPLVLFPLISLGIAAVAVLDDASRGNAEQLTRKLLLAAVLVNFVLGVVMLLTMANTTLKLLAGVHRGSGLRAFLGGAAVFIAGVLSLGLALFVFPWCVGLVAIVVDSFV